ncbi:type II toxin-antitoxin system HicB family antitoxin [Streptomyces sp. NPDC127066]|uniref:type II toxin-antitoxin system HicB family antitoxin n=1 Tax=Streptomyces sp. NPDC127066 TaxID=3347125 RepID=UPI00364E0965
MSAYRVIARRTGEWWALEVPDLPGVFSQAKRLEQADEAAREAIAVMLDVETEEVSVSIEPVLPDEAREVIEAAHRAQEEARKAAELERQAMQRAAAVLTRELSQRDAGRFLGVSFQRIHQLLKGYRPPETAGAPQRDTPSSSRSAADRSKPPSRSKPSNRTKTAA